MTLFNLLLSACSCSFVLQYTRTSRNTTWTRILLKWENVAKVDDFSSTRTSKGPAIVNSVDEKNISSFSLIVQVRIERTSPAGIIRQKRCEFSQRAEDQGAGCTVCLSLNESERAHAQVTKRALVDASWCAVTLTTIYYPLLPKYTVTPLSKEKKAGGRRIYSSRTRDTWGTTPLSRTGGAGQAPEGMNDKLANALRI
ncbi:hypothetical protein C8R45DRAFT_937123 [Mycena sanguinolenta]|nr:hypothetical protein C8R45DRAFT_937123 [Mycena sanguinolenta]